MRRRLMLKSIAQAAPVHTYIAESTYNENCYVDANHAAHVNTTAYQGIQSALSPPMAFENPVSIQAGDVLAYTGTQSYRNYINAGFYSNGTLVAYIGGFVPNAVVINNRWTSDFSGTVDAIAFSFGGGIVGMTVIDIHITRNGEAWLN